MSLRVTLAPGGRAELDPGELLPRHKNLVRSFLGNQKLRVENATDRPISITVDGLSIRLLGGGRRDRAPLPPWVNR